MKLGWDENNINLMKEYINKQINKYKRTIKLAFKWLL